MARSYGVTASQVVDVEPAVRTAIEAGGVHVLVASTDRETNVEVHRRLNAAVADALAEMEA